MSDLTLSKPAFVNLCKCGCGVLVKQLWCSRQAAEKHRGIAKKRTDRCNRPSPFCDGVNKLCLDCNTVKPVEMFTKTLYSQTGRKTYCKACLYARKKQDRQQKSEQLKPERDAKREQENIVRQQKQALAEEINGERKRLLAIKKLITQLRKRKDVVARIEAISAIEAAAAITDAMRFAQHKTLLLNSKLGTGRQSANELCAARLRAQFKDQIAMYMDGQVFTTEWFTLTAGYSIAELVAHITNQFRAGMDWHIPNSFHIDHIVPINYLFNTYPSDQAFLMAYKLSNLRPLYPYENKKKWTSFCKSHLAKIG
jgi:hypothetical protein